MKKEIFALSLIVLVLICHVPTIASPGTVQQAEDEIFEPDIFNPSIPAADSPQSITSFSETIPSDTGLDPDSDTNADAVYSEWDFSETIDPDVLYYPDAFALNSTVADGASGTHSPLQNPDWENTWVDDSAYIYDQTTALAETIWLNFTVPSTSHTIIGFEWTIRCSSGIAAPYSLMFWDYSLDSWDTIRSISSTMTLYSGQTGNSDHWSSTDVAIAVHGGNPGSGASFSWIKYAKITFQIITGSGSGYAESFFDVSDWSAAGAVENFGTDGDVGYFETHAETDNDYEGIEITGLSISITPDTFFEIRIKSNVTFDDYIQIRFYEGASYYYCSWSESTSFVTKREIMGALSGTAITTIDKIIIYVRIDLGPDVKISIDYLRIGSVMGWGHDSSTLEGTSTDNDADFTYTDEILNSDTRNCSAITTAGTAQWADFFFDYDTTTTEIDLERDYYSWVEFRWRCTSYVAGTNALYVSITGDGKKIAPAGGYRYSTFDWVTERYNFKEATSDATTNYVDFIIYTDAVGEGAVFEVDYVRWYGFNNWTFNSAGAETTDAVCYYDSGEDALAMQSTLSTGAEYIVMRSRNLTINYDITDMSIGMTVKVSANDSLSVAGQVSNGAISTVWENILYDDWMTIWVPMDAGEDYSTFTYMDLKLRDWDDGTPSSGTYTMWIKDNVTIRPSWYDASGESDTFADSFADIDDWSLYANEGNDAISTDGDILTWVMEQDGATDSDYIVCTVPTNIDCTNGYYVEVRYRYNTTNNAAAAIFGKHSADFPSGDTFTIENGIYDTASWNTEKTYFVGQADLESVYFYIHLSTGHDKEMYIDYIRIAPSTETGWQDDCSNINGYSDISNDVIYADDDVVHLTGTGASSGAHYRHDAVNVKLSAYPFVEIRWKAPEAATIFMGTRDENDAWLYTTFGDGIEDGTWQIKRFNVLDLVAGNYLATIMIYDELANVQEVYIDYIKFYGIANFTHTQGASCTTNDFWYVDDGILYGEQDSGDYLGLNYDPAISVAQATYPVWNITTSDLGSSFSFRLYNGGWNEFNDEETRGAVPSGTITDIAFYTYIDTNIVTIKFWEDSTDPTISDFWIVPASPTIEDEITLVAFASDDVDGTYKCFFNAISYPSGFSDINYEATENSEQEGLWNYTFTTLDAGYYAWQVNVWDGANNATDLLVIQVITIELAITDIVLITTGSTDIQISGKTNMDATYTIYEDKGSGDVNKGSGTVYDGWFSISWAKESETGVDVALGIKFISGDYTEWVNGSYSVASAEVLSISNTVYTSNDVSNTLSGHANLNCDYYIYENDTQVDTGALTAGSFSLSWNRNSTDGLISWGAKFTDGTTDRWVNGSYYNTPTTYDDLMLSAISFTAGTEEIAVFIQTNWNNCTIHLYDNDTIKASGNEGSLSYENPQSVGLHRVGVYVNGTAQNLWVNFTYSVTADADLSITALTFDTSGVNISVFVNSNWGNCTVTLYEDDVEKDTGNEGFLTYTKATAAGNYSVGIKIDGTADLIWANFTYTIGAEDSLSITALTFGTSGADVTAFATTNWMNTTLTIYENDVQKDTANEGTTLSYTKATTAGDYSIGLKIDGTADLVWANYTYTITAEDSLSITALTFDNSGLNITIFVNSNWGNCTVTLYEDDVQKTTGSEGSLSYLKTTTTGNYDVGVKIDGTADLVWANYTYSINVTSLEVSNPVYSTTTTENQVSGHANLDCNYYVFSNDSYQSVSGSLTAGSFSVTWTRLTAVALHRWGIKFNVSGTTRWVNGSYDVSATTFLVSDPTVTDSSDEIAVSVYANIAGNYYVFSNDSYQSVSGGFAVGNVLVRWSKLTVVGLHRWGIKFNISGGTTRWINGSYDVSATTFLVSHPIASTTDVEVKVSGYINLNCDYEIYSNDSSIDTGSLTTGSFEVSWPRNSTIGTHSWGIEFNSSGTIRWVNGSYYVSATYGTAKIYTYNQGGDYIDWEQFTFLVNGSQVYGNEFYDRTDHVYLIIIQDVFGSNLYSATHSWARTIKITLNVYTFVVANMLDDQFIYFNMTRTGGATWSRHISPTKDIEFELLYAATYNYEYTTIATDGTVRTATGTVTVEADTAVIIFEFGLVKILSEIRMIAPGGGIGKEYVDKQFATVNATLGVMWAFLWLIGGFLILALWVVPFVSRRKRKGSYSPSSTPSSGSSKPKPSGASVVYSSAAQKAKKEQKKLGIRQDDDSIEYGPRQ